MSENEACRRRRLSLGLTLDQIAADWGFCDPAAISRWERGLRPNLPGGRDAAAYKATLDARTKKQHATGSVR